MEIQEEAEVENGDKVKSENQDTFCQVKKSPSRLVKTQLDLSKYVGPYSRRKEFIQILNLVFIQGRMNPT